MLGTLGPVQLIDPLRSINQLRPVAADAARLVYRCVAHGAITYADRPCANGPNEGEAGEMGSFHLRSHATDSRAPEVIGNAPLPAPTTTARPRTGQRRADKREQQWLRCSALQQRINHVNSAMRVGYRGRRGEKLRAQWQQLKSTYYDQRCLGVH